MWCICMCKKPYIFLSGVRRGDPTPEHLKCPPGLNLVFTRSSGAAGFTARGMLQHHILLLVHTGTSDPPRMACIELSTRVDSSVGVQLAPSWRPRGGH